MKLPIAKQLKKQSQVQIAFLQDEIVDILYSLTDDLILHGGTAIWRCYHGKRFSEDLDFYSLSFTNIMKEFHESVISHGLSVPRIEDTGNVIFSTIRNNDATIREYPQFHPGEKQSEFVIVFSVALLWVIS